MIGKDENSWEEEMIASHEERSAAIEKIKEEVYSRYEGEFDDELSSLKDLIDKVSMEIVDETGSIIFIDEAKSFIKIKLENKINNLFNY